MAPENIGGAAGFSDSPKLSDGIFRSGCRLNTPTSTTRC